MTNPRKPQLNGQPMKKKQANGLIFRIPEIKVLNSVVVSCERQTAREMAQLNKAALAEHWAKNFFSGNVESKSEEWTYRTGTLACIKGAVSFSFLIIS